MKYIKGDRVKIKTWKEMEKEYGLSINKSIKGMAIYFTRKLEVELTKLNCDRILTIDNAYPPGTQDSYSFYCMKEIGHKWFDNNIKYLAEHYNKPIPIQNRFDFLDL